MGFHPSFHPEQPNAKLFHLTLFRRRLSGIFGFASTKQTELKADLCVLVLRCAYIVVLRPLCPVSLFVCMCGVEVKTKQSRNAAQINRHASAFDAPKYP